MSKVMDDASVSDTMESLNMLDDYHKLKEYYYEKYMTQLREKIKELDDKSAVVSNAHRKGSADPKKQMRGLTKPAKLNRSSEFSNDDAGGHFPNSQNKDNILHQNGDSSNQLMTDGRLSQIVEQTSRENSARSETKQTSRNKISGQGRGSSRSRKQMNINLNPLAGNLDITPAEIGKAAAIALEKRCPRMDLPQLHCLRTVSDLDDERSSEVEQEELREHRRKDYVSHVSQLRLMYQRAQANNAQATRIIEAREDDPLRIYNTSIIADMSNNLFSIKDRRSRVVKFTHPDSVRVLDSEEIKEMPEELSTLRLTDRRTPPTSDLGGANGKMFAPIAKEFVMGSTEPPHEYTVTPGAPLAIEATPPQLSHADPLSMGDVNTQAKVIEATVLSSYWQNYMHAGPSKFINNS